MTISQENAERTATDFAKQIGYGSYLCCGTEFSEGVTRNANLPFLNPSPPSWIVRFQSPVKPSEVSVDDGDFLICIEVDANTGVPSLLEGL